MIPLKTSPVEIDIPIQKLQQFLYSGLKTTWGVSDTDFDMYGRCYRNSIDKGYIPEVFVGDSANGQTAYKEAFFDETVNKAIGFFHHDNTKYEKGNSRARVCLLFIVNLQKLKPNIQHRADAEVRKDVELLLQLRKFSFEMTEIVTGFRNVFAEFDGWLRPGMITFGDIHPLHCFRINMDLLFDLNDC